MKKTEVLDIIKGLDDKECLEYEDINPKIRDGITFKCEKRYGGFEGSGEEHWVVFSTEKDGVKQLWKIEGFYMSYEGSNLEWDDLYEVEAYEKTVIDYRKV